MALTIETSLTDSFIQKELLKIDPKLLILFKEINATVFTSVFKPAYVSLIGVLLGQIISYQQAKKLRKNIYIRLGVNFTINDFEALSDEELAILGLPLAKIELIRRVNAFILENKLNLEKTDGMLLLKQIKGVGEWTLTAARLTSAKETDLDLFPCGDYFIRKRVRRLYQLSKVPSIKEMKEISSKWSPYRSVVCWRLWHWF